MDQSDSSSDDDCIYTNAAMKLSAMNRKDRSKHRIEDDEDEDEDYSYADNPPQNQNESVQNVEKTETEKPNSEVIESIPPKQNENEDQVEISSTDEASDDESPIISIEDSIDIPAQRRGRSKRKLPEYVTTPKSKKKTKIGSPRFSSSNLVDSIEQELNALNDNSFNISTDNLEESFVVIGSPIANKKNTDDDYEVSIKVLWKSNEVKRFELRRNESFQKIFLQLAKLENVQEDQIFITRKDKRINIFDTPLSLNSRITDIYEGGVVSAEMAKKNKSKPADSEEVEGLCKIKIQSSDRRNLVVTVKCDEPLTVLAKNCEEQLGIPVSKMKFYFDGDQLDINETPESLDIDDEACFDLKIIN